MLEPEPKSARAGGIASREACAEALAGDDRSEDLSPAARRDHRRDPRPRREPRGLDLARHPAATEWRATSQGQTLGHVPFRQELGAGGGGMRGVDALDLGQQDEQPRTDQHRDLRGEGVVVPEGDLVRSRGVVLIHDRDDAELEQGLERVPRVHVARALGQVRRREQDLRGLESLSAKGRVPRALQPYLSERRGGLQPRKRPWPVREPQPRQPERDRARRNHDDGLASTHERADLRGARPEQGPPDLSAPVGDERRAELDDDGHGFCEPSPTTRYWRRHRSR